MVAGGNKREACDIRIYARFRDCFRVGFVIGVHLFRYRDVYIGVALVSSEPPQCLHLGRPLALFSISVSCGFSLANICAHSIWEIERRDYSII